MGTSDKLSCTAGLWAAVLCAIVLLAGCQREETPSTAAQDDGFQRLSFTGTPYEGDGDFAQQPWACVRDTRTGLIWEVKTAEPGLGYRQHTYTWHQPDDPANREGTGVRGGGECSDARCDTAGYVEAVNHTGLCGAHDWRMPTREELGTIVKRRPGRPGPTIDERYFPNTEAGEYWSGEAYRFHDSGAWAWNFVFGYDRVDWRKAAKHARLVRTDTHAPR